MSIEKSDILQGTLDLLILHGAAVVPVLGNVLPQRLRRIANDVHQGRGSVEPCWN